jgi:hypothetical protein
MSKEYRKRLKKMRLNKRDSSYDQKINDYIKNYESYIYDKPIEQSLKRRYNGSYYIIKDKNLL